MTSLPAKPTLAEYQALIKQLAVERGYEKETIAEVFTLLVEEVGELAKALRRVNGQKVGAHSKTHEVEDEVADILWLLVDLCNRLDVDLEEAFRAKEVKNQKRNSA